MGAALEKVFLEICIQGSVNDNQESGVFISVYIIAARCHPLNSY